MPINSQRISGIIMEGVLKDVVDGINARSYHVTAEKLQDDSGFYVTLNEHPYTQITFRMENG